MAVGSDKERIYITMPTELAQRVRDLAAAEDRNFSNMVNYIIRRYLDERQPSTAETSARGENCHE